MDERWHTHRVYADPHAGLDALLGAEWLLTNGTGSYSMGTVAACNTRRYHGLLVAAGGLPGSRPPVGRLLALNQVWEQLVLYPRGVAGTPDAPHQTLDLSTLAFRAMHDGSRTFAPRGVMMLREFDRGLSVRWAYSWGEIHFERELLLHWKQPAITLRYVVRGLEAAELDAQLRVHPMLTLRDFHALTRQHYAPPFEQTDGEIEYLTVNVEGQPDQAVTFWSSHGYFLPRPHWWNNVFYAADNERGQEDTEDYFVPAALEAPVAEDVVVTVTAALGRHVADPIAEADDRAAHLAPIVARLDAKPTPPAPVAPAKAPKGRVPPPRPAHTIRHSTLPTVLAIAADDFVVDRTIAGEKLSTILAGYPWFSDWGRDTFIALPGLLLCTGRFEEARKTLRTFGDAIFDGLVPNRFDDYDDKAAHYNTVDASLWYVHAAIEYVRATGDAESWWSWLAAACLRIIDAYVAGTRYDIVMDADGLISAGNPQTQLTWMDAACGDVVFTPRHGKCVEINALWHNALQGMAEMLDMDGGAGKHVPAKARTRFTEARDTCAKLADRVRRNYAKVFWNKAADCLFDHVFVDGQKATHADASIRPNQVFAASLPRSPLPLPKAKAVVAKVREKLLTPVGLRTLPPDDPRYHGRYTGDQFRRDEAYHQGTIWPWLIGPYAEAVLRAGAFSAAARAEARRALEPVLAQLDGESIGQLPEVYDGDDEPGRPRRPGGCIAQAWSVAEVLRALLLLTLRA